jgi:hypothetical protein
LSGCTAVFFWNYSKTPSAFHILCGESEHADAKKAADLALNADADSYFTIVAETKPKYENVHAGIMETFAKHKVTIKKGEEPREEGDGSIVELITPFYKRDTGKRAKFTATKGTTKLVRGNDDETDCSVQAQ